MMTPIHKFVGQDLLWTLSPMLKQQYELLAGEAVLATLDMSNWTKNALAITAEGNFSLERDGFFQQQVMLRVADEGPILGVYTRGWGYGSLQLASGDLFKWENANFWGTKKAWKTDTNIPLMQFQNSPWTRDLLVKIEPEAVAIPEHPLLVILGLYITVLSKRDSANTPGHRA